MQKKKFIITLLFAVLSIFMITACSDSSNESNSGGNNGGGGTVQPEPDAVKEFYNFNTWQHDRFNYLYSQYAILYDGSLYAWGNNNHGQLGLGITDENVDHKNKKKVIIPGKVIQLIFQLAFFNDSATSFLNTTYSFYAITDNGELYVWGYNGYGVLGVGDTVDRNTPTKVNLPSKIKELITGSSTYAILEDGSLYAWGRNNYGQLGVGDEVDRNIPTKVNLSGKIKKYTNDAWSYYAVLEDGSLYAWGDNAYGRLGVGDKVDRNTPIKVNLSGTIKELIINISSIYTILADGSLYAWGKNYNGTLGVANNEESISIPTLVTGITGTIKKVLYGSGQRYFLTEDGLLYGTGSNYSNYPVKIEFKDK